MRIQLILESMDGPMCWHLQQNKNRILINSKCVRLCVVHSSEDITPIVCLLSKRHLSAWLSWEPRRFPNFIQCHSAFLGRQAAWEDGKWDKIMRKWWKMKQSHEKEVERPREQRKEEAEKRRHEETKKRRKEETDKGRDRDICENTIRQF